MRRCRGAEPSSAASSARRRRRQLRAVGRPAPRGPPKPARCSLCGQERRTTLQSGRSRTSGTRLFLGKRSALCAMASAASRGSDSIALRERRPLSEREHLSARLMLIANLSTNPCPLYRSTSVLRLAGRVRASYVSSSPPTMIVRRDCAWGTLPDTGASTMTAPLATSRASFRLPRRLARAGSPGIFPGSDGENPVGRGRLPQASVIGQRREHDVGRRGDLAWGVARRGPPPRGAARVIGASLTVKRVPAGEEPGCHVEFQVPRPMKPSVVVVVAVIF